MTCDAGMLPEIYKRMHSYHHTSGASHSRLLGRCSGCWSFRRRHSCQPVSKGTTRAHSATANARAPAPVTVATETEQLSQSYWARTLSTVWTMTHPVLQLYTAVRPETRREGSTTAPFVGADSVGHNAVHVRWCWPHGLALGQESVTVLPGDRQVR